MVLTVNQRARDCVKLFEAAGYPVKAVLFNLGKTRVVLRGKRHAPAGYVQPRSRKMAEQALDFAICASDGDIHPQEIIFDKHERRLVLSGSDGAEYEDPIKDDPPKPIISPSEDRRYIPKPIRREVFDRDGMVCSYCGTKEGEFELDHIVPWSRGGKHEADNLCVACYDCNRRKGNKTLSEWKQ